MNWIIRKSNKMPYHTYLGVIFECLTDEIKDYNWIISDLEYISSVAELPVNMDDEYFILNADQLEVLLNKKIQIIWGVIIGVPNSKEVNIIENELPFAEGNDLIWRNGNLQYPGAEIEVICFDSGYTIVKFAREDLSKKFKVYFGEEAIELERFK